MSAALLMLSSGLQLSLAVTFKASMTNLLGSADLQTLALSRCFSLITLVTNRTRKYLIIISQSRVAYLTFSVLLATIFAIQIWQGILLLFFSGTSKKNLKIQLQVLLMISGTSCPEKMWCPIIGGVQGQDGWSTGQLRWWGAALPVAGGGCWMGSNVPSNLSHSVIS